MPRFVHISRPLELSTARVAWEQSNAEAPSDVVSISVDGSRLVFDVNGTSASTHIAAEVADALLVLIAPRTSHWEGAAKQLVKLSHFSLRARAQAFLRWARESLNTRKKGQ